MEILVKNIKAKIDEAGMKQKYLAEKIGLSKSKLSAMLNGSRKIALEEYFAICTVLGVDAVELYEESKKAG